MSAVGPGDLVSISGRIMSDPVLQLAEALADLAETLKNVMDVAALGALLEGLVMTGISQSAASANESTKAGLAVVQNALAQPALNPQPAQSSKGHGKAGAKQQLDSDRRQSAGHELVDQAGDLLVKIRDDLRRSPVTDLLVASTGFSVVAALTRSYLEPQTSELLKGSDMTVLGKVTRVLTSSDERIDLLRRSILRYLSPATADKAYSALRSRRFLNLELVELVVQPPALQVLPLAIFI